MVYRRLNQCIACIDNKVHNGGEDREKIVTRDAEEENGSEVDGKKKPTQP